MSTLRVNSIEDLGFDDVVTNGVIQKGALPSGTILQVVQAVKTDTTTLSTITQGTFSDVSGLSATITPSSSSSKILVLTKLQMSTAQANIQSGVAYRILRDSTAIGLGDANGSRTRLTGNIIVASSDNNNQISGLSDFFLDSPGTTSAVTYKIQAGNVVATGGAVTLYINRTANNVNVVEVSSPISSITLMEVAG